MSQCENCPAPKMPGRGRHYCEACNALSQAKLKRKSALRYKKWALKVGPEAVKAHWDKLANEFRAKGYPRN